MPICDGCDYLGSCAILDNIDRANANGETLSLSRCMRRSVDGVSETQQSYQRRLTKETQMQEERKKRR